MPNIVVRATVVTDVPQHIAKAAEVLARAAAGLVLEGIDASIDMGIALEQPEEGDDG